MKKLRLLAVALALLSGCSFLEPQPDRTRYFVLDGSNVADSQPVPNPDSAVIGVGPVRLPDYLRRVEIVRRVATNRLHIASDEQWGEALDVGFGRALAQDLGRRLRNPAVVRLPGLASLRVDIEVPVEVVRFEADENGVVHLVARWIVKPTREGSKRVAHGSQIHEAAAGSTTTEVVEAMGRAIATLANDIATAIEMPPSAASGAH